MKTVKSTEDLKRFALSKGASASFGGERFNSTADKVVAVSTPKPEAQPVSQVVIPDVAKTIPQPAAVDVLPAIKDAMAPIIQCAVDAMAASVSDIAKDNARVMQEVMKAVERITTAPPAAATNTHAGSEFIAKAWQLKVNRDTRGFMDTVDIKQV